MTSPSKYFENLDGFRTLAASAVILSHSGFEDLLNLLKGSDVFYPLLSFFSSGQNGVTFFFVLSGFLITNLLLQERDKFSAINIKNFYIRRALRIWPLFFLVIVFGFLVYPGFKEILGIQHSLSADWRYYVSFLSNFDVIRVSKNGLMDSFPMMLGITWSVSIEEQFYLFWPLVFLLPHRYISIVLLLILSLSIFYRLVNYEDFDKIYFHTFSEITPLSIGGILSLMMRKDSIAKVIAHRISNKRLNLLIYTIGFLCLIYLPFYVGAFSNSIIKILGYTFFGFIILDQSFNSNPIYMMKNNKPLSDLGKYTYGMYLLHPIVLQFFDQLMEVAIRVNNSVVPSTIKCVLVLLVTILVSKLSFHLFESKFLTIKKRFSKV